ncbi:hypothetical protein H0H81_001840 [Sphagnurus paluster]|uniref:Protein kinase domain-containing protein n=1 Tax=Sphagnurus paluster TaxID=117069 RepID=A0A9P7KIJ9_9AGAR|nr:hypothetical protein H0H81_001840 [Sphagnurus paluster]
MTDLQPEYYHPGSQLSLQLVQKNGPHLPLTVTVVEVFTPFTMSQSTNTTHHPWSPTAEATAAAKRIAPYYDPHFQPTDFPDEDDAPGWEGTVIPLCYAAGTLSLEKRCIAPDVLLIEYLPDAKMLKDVDPSVVELPLLHALVAAARTFGELGVMHTDFNPGNVLSVPGTRPTRAVVILRTRVCGRGSQRRSGAVL